jgi:transposase
MEIVEKSITAGDFPAGSGQHFADIKDLDSALEKLLENAVTIERMSLEKEELVAENDKLKADLALALQKRFGRSSEQHVHPEQMSLFNEAEKESRPELPEPEIEEITYKRKKSRKPTEEKYAGLPEETIDYELTEEERDCPECGSAMKEIGVDERRELVYIPAVLKIVVHRQHKYVCVSDECQDENGKTTIVMARAPEAVIPHSPASASLIAYIMSKKYVEGVPLYRQESQFSYEGIAISRQNMANWVIKGASHLKRVYDLMHLALLGHTFIHADETEIQVLCEPGKKATSKSYMWLYASGTFGVPIFLYEYTRSRSANHPKEFLCGFRGHLQTDGYGGYNHVENVTIMGCFSHARREFVDILKALPEGADVTKTLAYDAVAYIDSLFALERSYAGMTPDERLAARREKSLPVLEAYHEWLLAKKKSALPASKIGHAINYSLNQWDKLKVFCQNGEVDLSNNRAERGIKPFVMGRKAWLFAKMPAGAEASAIVYSIVETAKANGLNPFRYLEHLLAALPNVMPGDDESVGRLLPWSDSLPDDVWTPKTTE